MKGNNVSPWSERFTWLWFNEPEIFDMTQEDFDNIAKGLHDRNITTAMTFSRTHFRLSFYPVWDKITECISKIVKACHKYGIKVVEHHSCCLMFDKNFPERNKEIAELDPKKWVGVSEFHDEPVIDGVNLMSCTQVDGRTDKTTKTLYNAHIMCFNDPQYRKIYFDYVKTLLDTGIDGIMNDDVQYLGRGHACTCRHCRRMFFEQTGYTLPGPEHWEEFFENYNDPVYIAWKRFKKQSTERFYRDLTVLYEEYGKPLMRPNYSSTVITHDRTRYGFDTCLDLWDFIFQENCFSNVIKESYLQSMSEAVHRFAAAERKGRPSMSMFYPDREDSTYFSWALARSWGQLYTGTYNDIDITPLEKPYRLFEIKYSEFYANPKKFSDLAFWFSTDTRDYVENAREACMNPFIARMQSAYVAGLGIDMVFQDDTQEELAKHKNIVFQSVASISNEALARISRFVSDGGNIMVYGEFAAFDENAKARSKQEKEAMLGFKLEKGTQKYGKGTVTVSDEIVGRPEFQPEVYTPRNVEGSTPCRTVPCHYERHLEIGQRMCELVGDGQVARLGETDGRLVSTAYLTDGGFALHLLNIANTVSEKECDADHEAHIPCYEKGAKKLDGFTVSIKKPPIEADPAKAALVSPELDHEIPLQIKEQNGRWELTVPDGCFSGYAMIIVRLG